MGLWLFPLWCSVFSKLSTLNTYYFLNWKIGKCKYFHSIRLCLKRDGRKLTMSGWTIGANSSLPPRSVIDLHLCQGIMVGGACLCPLMLGLVMWLALANGKLADMVPAEAWNLPVQVDVHTLAPVSYQGNIIPWVASGSRKRRDTWSRSRPRLHPRTNHSRAQAK